MVCNIKQRDLFITKKDLYQVVTYMYSISRQESDLKGTPVVFTNADPRWPGARCMCVCVCNTHMCVCVCNTYMCVCVCNTHMCVCVCNTHMCVCVCNTHMCVCVCNT